MTPAIDFTSQRMLHTLVAAHREAWADLQRSEGNDKEAAEDCDALALALSLTHAKTAEGLRAKGEVIRSRLLGGTVDALIDDIGADAIDGKLILSFAQDALQLAQE